MGYDMSVIAPDDEAIGQRDAASKRFHEAYTAVMAARRDDSPDLDDAQAEADQALDALDKADVTYFRLNVWGMSRMVDAMDRLGMLAPAAPRNWPKPEDFGLSEWPDDDDPRPEARKYHQAHRKVLAQTSPDSPGIPVHKFGSNDGWIVTPLEIAGALKMLEIADPELREEVRLTWETQDTSSSRFDQWVEFLRYAQDHDGFEVW